MGSLEGHRICWYPLKSLIDGSEKILIIIILLITWKILSCESHRRTFLSNKLCFFYPIRTQSVCENRIGIFQYSFDIYCPEVDVLLLTLFKLMN